MSSDGFITIKQFHDALVRAVLEELDGVGLVRDARMSQGLYDLIVATGYEVKRASGHMNYRVVAGRVRVKLQRILDRAHRPKRKAREPLKRRRK